MIAAGEELYLIGISSAPRGPISPQLSQQAIDYITCTALTPPWYALFENLLVEQLPSALNSKLYFPSFSSLSTLNFIYLFQDRASDSLVWPQTLCG